VEPHQLDLFSELPPGSIPHRKPIELVMSADALVKWKNQIVAYQQRARTSSPASQVALFDLAPVHSDPALIDPFSQRQHPMSFYRMPADGSGACIYFVIDSAAQLILYIGETYCSKERWTGKHDCKHYLDRYQDLHYRHGLKSAVNIAFWWDAPVKTRARQQLELSLIMTWRSPFNRENWVLWGTPFG
jgi:hypothetical protein